MSQPTAPFHESAVRQQIRILLSAMPDVAVSMDAFGNLLATYKRGESGAKWLFNAHMDHPAYVGGEFKGGVPKAYLERGFPVKNFGAFSMWDLPPFEVADGCIRSRACDDLIGCAAMIAALEQLQEKSVEAWVIFAFTCAEEVGLLGATYLARSGLLPADVKIVSLETSAESPPAKMHEGVVVRVGDKASVFDPGLTAEIWARAEREGIPAQRCLMSGGTCEGSAYQAFGYKTAALCVPLGNYHNCAPDGGIDSEYVSLADTVAMAQLCFAIASGPSDSDLSGALRERLERGLEAALATEVRLQGVDCETPETKVRGKA
jgi:endoglucanase